MKIEKGNAYTDRDGGKVIVVENDNARDLYPLLAEYSDGCQCWLNKGGKFYNGEQESRRDIVGEWIETTDESGQSPGFEAHTVDVSQIASLEEQQFNGLSLLFYGDDGKPACWDDNAATGYEHLAGILQEAHDQAASGKGKERHANGKPFTEQPIMAIGRMCGLGFQTGQIQKKVQEATGMAARGETDAAIRELLGAINYAAAAVLLIREQKSAAQ